MNYVRFCKAALLLVVLVACFGCKSKQEKPAAGTGTPQQNAAAPSATPQGNTGSQAISPQDKKDAEAAAALVLSRLEKGDFSAVYKDASPGFKQIGTEDQFVAKFQHTRLKVGVLKNPREINADMRPNKSVVLVYRLENEHFTTDFRLTLVRAQDGKMVLDGLNQHDEPKK